MVSMANRCRAFLALGTLSLALSLGTAALDGAVPSMSIAHPEHLSIQGQNRVSFLANAPFEQTVAAHFDLVSKDGLVSEPVFDTVLSLGTASREFSFAITPAQLAPFALGETVVLRGHVGLSFTEAEMSLTASVAEASGWVLNVPATAVVYSTTDSLIRFRTVNPKGKPLQANLKLKFKNLKGKVVAKWTYPIVALPGESVQNVTVPVSVCLQAKLKGASSLRSFLFVGGNKKASGQSLLDWDLSVSASADKVTGPAPLLVSFTALTSGGSAPYAYDWNFGDGSAHSAVQNPIHAFVSPGVYTAQLTVTDNRSGVVTAAPIVVAAQ